MKTVLVTAIGSFSADITIKTLKNQGYFVVGCDIYDKVLIADAYNVDKFYKAPLAINEAEYIGFLKNICIENSVKFILPLTDVEVDTLNHNRQWFDENGICICLSPEDTIEICRNKYNLARFAEKLEFVNTIPTQMFSKEIVIESFPVVCKPYNGRSSRGRTYINSAAEWREFCETSGASECVVQPKIQGSVVTVDVICDKYGGAVAVAREEMLRTQNGAGTSVYVFNDSDLEKTCTKLALELGITGCVNFEFILDKDGKYHFMECNPRFSGGLEFSCLTGYDFVTNHLKCFTNEHIDKKSAFRNMYIARKYEEYITCVE